MSTLHVPRVDQLDAVLWSEELFSLFSVQVQRALKYFPSSFLVRWGSLIEGLFQYSCRELSLRNTQSTFGQSLFGLEYRDANDSNQIPKLRLRLLAVLKIAPYLYEKSVRMLLSRFENLSNTTNYLEDKFHTLQIYLTIINFCVFLQQAKYPTVSDRILGIRPLYPSQKGMRTIEYESINRELLWHGFAELLSFVLPLVNVYRVKGFVQRLFKPLYSQRKDVLLNWNCGICGQSPTFPHEFGCHHMFCYYCIASHVLADQNYLCIDCKHQADGFSSIKPVSLNVWLKNKH